MNDTLFQQSFKDGACWKITDIMDRTQGWDPGCRAVKCRALKGPQDRKISALGLGGFTTGIHYLGLVFLWRMQVEKG